MALVVTAGADKLRVKQITLIVKNTREATVQISAGEKMILADDQVSGSGVEMTSNEALTIEPQSSAALLLSQ